MKLAASTFMVEEETTQEESVLFSNIYILFPIGSSKCIYDNILPDSFLFNYLLGKLGVINLYFHPRENYVFQNL
jgi:hypothetical protein